jgi:hypothetical protein
MLNYGDLARPDLPRPTCRVRLVCGPPAAGKSTYVRAHAQPTDILIDIDAIARELGFDRDRPDSEVSEFLRIRNARLANLAKMPATRTAWVIIGAPSISLRQWWCNILNVKPNDLILLLPSRDQLQQRIINDPDRQNVRAHHFALVDKWLARERNDDPGILKRGCDQNGFPIDPLHPWNRA